MTVVGGRLFLLETLYARESLSSGVRGRLSRFRIDRSRTFLETVVTVDKHVED